MSFRNFPKGWGLDFFHKRGRVGKIGGRVVLKKGGTLSLVSILTIPFQSYLSLSEWWCVFCLFTPYLSVFFRFHATWEELSLTEFNQQMYGCVSLLAPVCAVCLSECV